MAGRGTVSSVRGGRSAAGSRGAGGMCRAYQTRSSVYQHATAEVRLAINSNIACQSCFELGIQTWPEYKPMSE